MRLFVVSGMLHSSCTYLTSYDDNTRKIARDLCAIDKAVDDGKNKGKMYRLK